MTKRIIVSVDTNAWFNIRKKFPGMTDRKRAIVLDVISENFNKEFMNKLQSELTDTSKDFKMKQLTKRLLYG